MASHDLINTKPTILGATLGAIPGIAAKPLERFSFAPAFSERFFKNRGGPRAPETFPKGPNLENKKAISVETFALSLENFAVFAIQRRTKAYTTTAERKSFGELFWPQRKTFQAGGGYKNPYKNQENHIHHRNLSSVDPLFIFLQRKDLHWSRAVYAFFFPAISLENFNLDPQLSPPPPKTKAFVDGTLEILIPLNISIPEGGEIRKIRAPIKIKSALPPPPKKNYPQKRGILRTWFFLQKERIFSRCP